MTAEEKAVDHASWMKTIAIPTSTEHVNNLTPT
jgi:hypothetical protein